MNLNQLYCMGFFFQAKNSAVHVNMYVHNKKPKKMSSNYKQVQMLCILNNKKKSY